MQELNQNPQYQNYKFTPETIIFCARKFMRDTAKQNELRGIDESDDSIFKLAINMAISDWNTTPPLLAAVGLEDFPAFDWLIISTAMFVLQSAGVLQYRNELQYSDAGTSVNPWSKGPVYFQTAGFWANLCEQKKRDYKYALNVSKTFGIARTSEYMMWDYSGLFTGVPGDNVRGSGPSSVAGGALGVQQNIQELKNKPRKRTQINFKIDSWVNDGVDMLYTYVFYHNFMSEVDARITDPVTGADLRSQVSIFFDSKNSIKLTVPMQPDGRFEASMIVFEI